MFFWLDEDLSMNRQLPRVRVLLVILFVTATVGCGSDPSKRDPNVNYGPSNKDMLIDFGAMLKAYIKENKRAPSKVADFDRYAPAFSGAEEGLRTKTVIYQWGQPISTDAKAAGTVLAYEKEAEASGGWVLMQDGNIKKMSADEFKAAPKAGK
jgi:hypothetical protein